MIIKDSIDSFESNDLGIYSWFDKFNKSWNIKEYFYCPRTVLIMSTFLTRRFPAKCQMLIYILIFLEIAVTQGYYFFVKLLKSNGDLGSLRYECCRQIL